MITYDASAEGHISFGSASQINTTYTTYLINA